MTPRRTEVTLWVLTAAATFAIGVQWSRVPFQVADGEYAFSAPARTPYEHPSGLLAEAAGEVVATNPFRLDRRPAEASGDSPVDEAADAGWPTDAELARPLLAVAGIVGPPWEAVIEGVPGVEEGVLVRAGDVLGDLTVRSVQPDLVVIEANDTTWHLGMKNPWQ